MLSHLHFRRNIVCFCSVLAAKIDPNKELQLISHSQQHSVFWRNRSSQRFNDSFMEHVQITFNII